TGGGGGNPTWVGSVTGGSLPGAKKNIAGGRHIRNWQRYNWNGSGVTTRHNAAGDAFRFEFRNNGSGGAMGRLGKHYSGVRCDNVPYNWVVDYNASFSDSGSGRNYKESVYGWVFETTRWNTNTEMDEYYIISKYDNPSPADPIVSTRTIDGALYELHIGPIETGRRFKAVRVDGQGHDGPIRLQPFFDWFRDYGMRNHYVDSVCVATEIHNGSHNGWSQVTNIILP
ncbi:MAG: hypothetical protein ACR2NP_02775, partial [Pirellulaceae bacterium]